MNRVVLDSSALLAGLFLEEGAASIATVGPSILISAVSLAEVLLRAMDRGVPVSETESAIDRFALTVVPFDATQASTAARLPRAANNRDLPFEAWACLALAAVRNAPVVTANPIVAALRVGVSIELIG
jgi:PIN domain nuclease of toxin-antitoxin system